MAVVFGARHFDHFHFDGQWNDYWHSGRSVVSQWWGCSSSSCTKGFHESKGNFHSTVQTQFFGNSALA